MKKVTIILTFVSLLLLATTSSAQLIKVGLGGGYTSVTTNNIFEDGYQYGGKIVVAIPLLPLTVAANLYNNPFSTEIGDVSYESSFFSGGLGAEFTILPGPIKPYVGAELLYTASGENKIDGNNIGESENKFGLGLGAGAYFTLLPLIDLDLSAHYNMNSLLSSGDNFNTLHVRLNVLFNLF